jgi:hypothetical protein
MSNFFSFISLILFGAIGWVICVAIYLAGETFFRADQSALIHFILTPFVFMGLSIVYFRYINLTRPIITALAITLIFIILDFFIVALFIEKSLYLFSNIMRTWLPFIFIFLTVFLTGLKYTDQTLGR